MTLGTWIDQFRARFNERELTYMKAHKAEIALQLKDPETGQIHLHKLTWQAKEAEDLKVVQA